MTPPVFPLLAAASAVTALIGTDPVRAFPDDAPQGQVTPYVIWSTTVGTAYNVMDKNSPPADRVRVTITIVADTASARDALYEAARAALEPGGYLSSLNYSGFDPETKRYTTSFDFSFILAHDVS